MLSWLVAVLRHWDWIRNQPPPYPAEQSNATLDEQIGMSSD